MRTILGAMVVALATFAPTAKAQVLVFDYKINTGAVSSVASLTLIAGGAGTMFSLTSLTSGPSPKITDLYWSCNDCGSPMFSELLGVASISQGSFAMDGYTFNFKADLGNPGMLSGGTATWQGTGLPSTFLGERTSTFPNPNAFAMVDVIGNINGHYVATAVVPIPEPGTYAMMLAGLGLLGFMARRRMPRT